MTLEVRKQQADDNFVIFWADNPVFRDAIVVLGGKITTRYAKHGVEVSWDIRIDETKKQDCIDFCKRIKNGMDKP